MRARLVLLVALAALHPIAASSAEDEETRAAMARMVGALQEVLPLSLDDRSFAAAENRDAIRAALAELSRSGRELPGHAAPTDAGFAFLSRSLERDTRAIEQRYELEQYEQARFLLHEVTENCVACHSRRPDPKARALGLRLVDDDALKDLPLIERVRLEVATRQFDRALASYAELFAGPDFSPADLDLLGYIDGYLEVCLRVRVAECNPAPALQQLAARGNVPKALKRNLDSWLASLQRLDERRPLRVELAEVRRLVEEASDRNVYPDDRSALVLYFTASGLGNRYIAEGDPKLEDLSETYYWLGYVETRVGRAFWPSEGEYLLEASVRVAPGSDAAGRAYELLEDVAAVGYSGTGGQALPEDVVARLAELRALLVDAGRLSAPDAPTLP